MTWRSVSSPLCFLRASAGHSSWIPGPAARPRDEAQERQGLPLRRRGAEKRLQKKNSRETDDLARMAPCFSPLKGFERGGGIAQGLGS